MNTVKQDFKDLIKKDLKVICDKYIRKYKYNENKEDVKNELENNHNSLKEIIIIEEKLGREINMSEIMYYVEQRNKLVLN